MSISPENHYQFLGLPVGAPPWQVEVALERLSEQAANVVYQSPQSSHELWERIRRIKEDLLSGDERREAYNQLLQAHAPEGSTDTQAASLSTAFRESKLSTQGFKKRTLPRSLWAAFAVALLIPVAAALLSRSSNGHKAGGLPVVLLSNSGKVSQGGFVSGKTATLRWTEVPRADSYRLEIATVPRDPKDSVVFAHPWLTTITKSAQYSITPVGKQIYYWRVQAHIAHSWLPFTRSQHFLVNQPEVGTPDLLIPKNGSVLFGKRLSLCWSSVPGAAHYVLSVEGMRAKVVNSTCSSIAVKAGQYGWTVAAQVRGAKLYTGSYSRLSIFKILLRAKLHKRQPVVALRQTKQAIRIVAFNFRRGTRGGTSSNSLAGTRVAASSDSIRSNAGSTNRGSHSSLVNRNGPSGTRHAVRPASTKTASGKAHPPTATAVPVNRPPPARASVPTTVVYVVVVPTPVRQTVMKISPRRSPSPAPITYVQPPAVHGTVIVSSGRPGTVINRPRSVPPASTQPGQGHKHDRCKRANCSDDDGDHDGD